MSLDEQACGCKTVCDDDGTTAYIPCLACALKNAGLMLVEAGNRISEAEQERLQVEAEEAERLRVQAEDYFGGSD
jgi:hypothetical protein